MDFEFLRPHLVTIAIGIVAGIALFVAQRYFFAAKEAPSAESAPQQHLGSPTQEARPDDEVHGMDVVNAYKGGNEPIVPPVEAAPSAVPDTATEHQRDE